jgi:hypothetical protein
MFQNAMTTDARGAMFTDVAGNQFNLNTSSGDRPGAKQLMILLFYLTFYCSSRIT